MDAQQQRIEFPYFFVGTFIEALFKAAGIKAPGPDFPTFS